MKRNYVAGNDYEFAIKLKDGEQRSFFGRFSERAPVSNPPKGDVVLTLKNNGCVIVEKDHECGKQAAQDQGDDDHLGEDLRSFFLLSSSHLRRRIGRSTDAEDRRHRKRQTVDRGQDLDAGQRILPDETGHEKGIVHRFIDPREQIGQKTGHRKLQQ